MDEKDLIKLSTLCIMIGMAGLIFFSLNQKEKETSTERIDGTVLSARNNRFYTTINLTHCTADKINLEKMDKESAAGLKGRNVTLEIVKTQSREQGSEMMFARKLIVNN